jgi:hypothetical protein
LLKDLGSVDPTFDRSLSLKNAQVQPYHNNSILEAQYRELLAATSCSSLECLRSIDSTTLNKGAEAALLAGYQTTPKLYSYGDYYFGPSVDGEYARLPPYSSEQS